MKHCVWLPLLGALILAGVGVLADERGIPKPNDAPPALSPEESARRFRVPPGFRMELIASEPLVREPSGVCWDERGRLFVAELHGYNLDGHYDIEELNKTGQLDRVVRRIHATEAAKKKAEAETYGTVKLLLDTDGDGRADQARVWADRLPPCYGLCPARGGLIAVCSTHIYYLADRDGDDRAEVREVLFRGFGFSILERAINGPIWGPDDWIYVGAAPVGSTIVGPHLPKPVELPTTDFRFKPDGSRLEPVSGRTGGLGSTFTEGGDRFVGSIGWPAHYIVPLPWHYLARNPNVPTPVLTVQVYPDRRVYPISQPHPWRLRRADDPGFAKFYTDRYGVAESAPNGYFTSACSPLVYQDTVLPGLRGQLLACEPAQNLIHRSVVQREGFGLQLRRLMGEEKTEFLASTDGWFHPIALAHSPDGSIAIADFYREIIEDYSAIPRYLQQQYSLINGKDHGRVWRLTHKDAPRGPSADMSRLTVEQLAAEVGSPLFWRRQTARRLLVERRARGVASHLARIVRSAGEPLAIHNALQSLEDLEALQPDDVTVALSHADSGVRRQALPLAERWLTSESSSSSLVDKVLSLVSDPDPSVRLQLALSLGASQDARAGSALVRLARVDGRNAWMRAALLSSVPDRCGVMLTDLLRDPVNLGEARELIEPLAAAVGTRRQESEVSAFFALLPTVKDSVLQVGCLRGFRAGVPKVGSLVLTEVGRDAIRQLGMSDNTEVRSEVRRLITALKLESPAERKTRLTRAEQEVGDIRLASATRVAAAEQLGAEDDLAVVRPLLEALPSSTPQVREAILGAIFARRERFPLLLDALERKTLPGSTLSAVQRAELLAERDPILRDRAAKLLQTTSGLDEVLFRRYIAALKQPRDAVRGEKVFREKCATCHQAHGLGVAVGPDLSSEFLRAEETIIQDLLAPSAVISPGFVTYSVATQAGQFVSGLLASESPTSVTVRLNEGKEQVILRKDIEALRALPVSLMPDDLVKTVTPQDAADVIAWLRRPPAQLILLDDNQELLAALTQGNGTAEFISSDKHSGNSCLRVTPLQRHSPRIKGWEFRIREKPASGEYRYLRFAWKSAGAEGVLLELADRGQWPPANQALRRYVAGKNSSGWQAVSVANAVPREWTVVTRDLWKDFGEFTLTGMAPTAMGGPALFDRMELLQTHGSGSR